MTRAGSLDLDRADANPNLEFMFRDLAQAMVRWREEGRRSSRTASKPRGVLLL